MKMNKKNTERIKNHISDFDKAIEDLEKKTRKDELIWSRIDNIKKLWAIRKYPIRLFDDREVRAVWDGENAKWWFSVLDIVAVLTP